MQGTKRWMMLLAALLLVLPACNPTGIDEGDSADVILEVLAMENPAVTGQGDTGGCTFEIQQWTAQLAAEPKNTLGGGQSPYNDVVMQTVLISYEWVGCGACNTTDRLVGLGNVTIPAGGSNSVTFEPIAFDDLVNGLPEIEGSTANLTLFFTGRTVEGTTITQTAFRQLHVETCTTGG